MGIKSMRRQELSLFNFSLVIVLVNTLINILAIRGIEKLPIEYVEYINGAISISRFMFLTAILMSFAGIGVIKEYSYGDSFVKVKTYGRNILVVNLLILLYLIFIWQTKNNYIIFQSTLNMFVYSIPMTISWIAYRLTKLDRKAEWQKSCGTYNVNENKNSFFWRFNIHYKKPSRVFTRTDILQEWGVWFIFNWVILLVIITSVKAKGLTLDMVINKYSILPTIFIGLCFIKPVLFIIDLFFNSVVVLDGECTGLVEKSRHRSNKVDYEYIVTNYDVKKEVKFTTSNPLYFKEGDNVRVYYTLLSKRLLTHHSSNK
ncbi:hypothetical protein SH2C18_50430 [Clostridium sediminicola]|uniref:hypothetical protein n=1 Tax=Clostridium sediminicola TaxID=3114879 RepID=UPI0031F1C8B0